MASVDEGGRAAVSCDNCRARKVKCVRLQNGSCQRCVNLGKGCSSGKVKSSRPYYQTSKEQFELMSLVVRHFLPNVSLEKDELREVVASIGSQGQQRCQQNIAHSGALDGQEKRREVYTMRGRKRKANGREDGCKRKRPSGVARIVSESAEDEVDEGLGQEGEEVDGQDGHIEEEVEEREDKGAGAKEVQEEERDGEEERSEEFGDGQDGDAGEEEGYGQENGSVEVFGGFRQDQSLGDAGAPGLQGTASPPETSAEQSAYRTRVQVRAGHCQSGQPVSFLSPPYTDSPCSSISDNNLAVHDAMQILRFHNGSCYGTFYAKIVTNLASTHARLLRGQPSVNSHIIDGNTIGVAYPHNLPARQQIEIAATRFFTEVNNVVYVLKYEQFQSTLEDIYTCGLPSTRSGLAIVYLILSFGQNSDHFYTEACWYSTAVLEEGTLESVQALMLMALCCLNRSQLNLAWVTIGSALRIAQSIGLHMHESNWKEESPFKIECKKRLWWSLYDLETITACTLGRLPGVHEQLCRVSTASNTEFDLNPYTPPGYTKASVSLGKLFNRSIRTIYLDNPAPVNPDTAIDKLLDSLQEWWNDLPAWLRPNCSIPSSHIRAINHLNLRYYHILSHLTRQYLLQSITKQASCTPELICRAGICENANTQSILLLRELHNKKLISNINFFDALYIIGNGAILFLRCLGNPSLELMAELEKTLPMVLLVDHLALGKAALESMQGLLQDLRSYCDPLHDQSFATEDAGGPIVDLNLDGVMLDFWDNALLWQQERPDEFN